MSRHPRGALYTGANGAAIASTEGLLGGKAVPPPPVVVVVVTVENGRSEQSVCVLGGVSNALRLWPDAGRNEG